MRKKLVSFLGGNRLEWKRKYGYYYQRNGVKPYATQNNTKTGTPTSQIRKMKSKQDVFSFDLREKGSPKGLPKSGAVLLGINNVTNTLERIVRHV